MKADTVRNIPWGNPQMVGNELDYLREVLESNYINEGAMTRSLEREVLRLSGRRRQYAVAVPSGTLAIMSALLALGAQPGDEVILPSFCFIATANAVEAIGCKVLLCDVERETMCLSAKTVDTALTHHTKFVLSLEFNGRQPNYDELETYCRDHKLILLTDSCMSMFSGECGTRGAASALSFSPNKIVTTGQGGMVLTNDPDIHERLLELKYQGSIDRMVQSQGGGFYPRLGLNLKLCDLQSSVGIAQCIRFWDRINHCKERDRWYYEQLPASCRTVDPKGYRIWTDVLLDDRDAVVAALTKASIGYHKFYRALQWQGRYGVEKSFPNSEYFSTHGLWLPSHHSIDIDDIAYITDVVRKAIPNGQ